MDKVSRFIREHKVYILIILSGLLLFAVNVLIFYPGFMSVDSLTQLSQVMGRTEITDWHPPVMVLVWQVLFKTTGRVGALLLFQLTLLWLGLVLLAAYAYRASASIKLACLPLVAGLLPFIINISGVIWKDCHMAFSLFLAAILILYLKQVKMKKYLRYITVVIVGVLIVYACLLRYNAFFAAIPLLYLAIIYGLRVKKMSHKIAYTLCAIIATFIIGSGVSSVMNARESHPSSAVMLDDIVNVLSEQDIDASGVNGRAKEIIQYSVHQCRDKELVFNAIAFCSGKDIGHDLAYNYNNELRKVWLYMLSHKTWDYLGFRLYAFTIFLFTPETRSYYWNEGIIENNMGQEVKLERLGDSLEVYVKDFGYKYFSILFMPWFWLLFNGVLLGCVYRRLKNIGLFVAVLSVSSTLYILSYAPVVIGVDYRYIYWSVLASLLAGFLVWMDLRKKS